MFNRLTLKIRKNRNMCLPGTYRQGFGLVVFLLLSAVYLTGGVYGQQAGQGEGGGRYRDWQIKNGRLHVDGQWVFLKEAVVLINFADPQEVNWLIENLPRLQEMHFNAVKLNCYWHHFDSDGDGVPEKSLEPLAKLIDVMFERGMFPILSLETYGVGGGQIPDGFWKRHPDALAVNAAGRTIRDTEYGFLTLVPSIFSPEFRQAARTFIRHIAKGVNTRKVLYFETTVEPQFMGRYNLCYSRHAREAYEQWQEANPDIEALDWPEEFPIPQSFRDSYAWNRFRAEFLAEWINGDAAAFREIAGQGAYIGVDYLETSGPEMRNRLGDSLIFLRNLTSANIIEINWHWHKLTRRPHYLAYDNVRAIMQETGRDWAITEHMTLNGSDYHVREVPAVLRNTIARGTGFGWEFVNIRPNTHNPFTLFNCDWSPKPLMAAVSDNWQGWLDELREKHGDDPEACF